MNLTASDRRIFKKMTEFPWPPDGGPGFYAALADSSVDRRPLHGITRRIIHDDPTEIVRFEYLSIRDQWRDYLAQSPDFREDEIDGLWATCLHALAVCDHDALHCLLKRLPRSSPRKTWTYPPYYSDFYNLFFGLLRCDGSLIEESQRRLLAKKLTADETASRDCLIALANDSPSEFNAAMTQKSKAIRRIRYMDPHYKLIDLDLHGFWMFSRYLKLNAHESWDAESALPWDAGLHKWAVSNESAAAAIDPSLVSATFCDQLTLRDDEGR